MGGPQEQWEEVVPLRAAVRGWWGCRGGAGGWGLLGCDVGVVVRHGMRWSGRFEMHVAYGPRYEGVRRTRRWMQVGQGGRLLSFAWNRFRRHTHVCQIRRTAACHS